MKNRKNLIYLSIGVVCILSVFIKQMAVTAGRNREISSVIAEWATKGKPVIIKEVVKEDVHIYVKITVTLTRISDGCYQAYVPRITQQRLQPGQLIFLNNTGLDPVGKVIEVSEDINVDTGMFPIKINLDVEAVSGKQKLIVYVDTKVIHDAICLPQDIVTFINGEYFVWKLRGGSAHKVPVVIGRQDGYGMIVEHGLQEGDRVVFQGHSQLSEGDKVNILESAFQETEND